MPPCPQQQRDFVVSVLSLALSSVSSLHTISPYSSVAYSFPWQLVGTGKTVTGEGQTTTPRKSRRSHLSRSFLSSPRLLEYTKDVRESVPDIEPSCIPTSWPAAGRGSIFCEIGPKWVSVDILTRLMNSARMYSSFSKMVRPLAASVASKLASCASERPLF